MFQATLADFVGYFWPLCLSVYTTYVLLANVKYLSKMHFLYGVLVSVGLVTIIVTHEIGHYVAMRIFGCVNLKIVLIGEDIGVLGRCSTMLSTGQWVASLFAGPASALVLGSVCLLLASKKCSHSAVTALQGIFCLGVMDFVINLLWFLPDTDGNQILRLISS